MEKEFVLIVELFNVEQPVLVSRIQSDHICLIDDFPLVDCFHVDDDLVFSTRHFRGDIRHHVAYQYDDGDRLSVEMLEDICDIETV